MGKKAREYRLLLTSYPITIEYKGVRDLLKIGLAESRELLRKKDETRDRESRPILIYCVHYKSLKKSFNKLEKYQFMGHGQVSFH